MSIRINTNIWQEIHSASVQWEQWNYDLHNSYIDNTFSRHSSGYQRSLPQMEHDLFPKVPFNLLFMCYDNFWQNMTLLNILQWKRVKYYTNTNESLLWQRTPCLPLLNIKVRATEIHVQGVHIMYTSLWM